ncbi:MAG: PaaI family thioesterase [Rhodobacteraceae bacterium]|nr:PaaI family thioesterase [Paracoccaceae bacterium]
MTPQDIQTLYDTHFAPWIQELGIQTLEVAPDSCRFLMPITPRLMRVGDILCGQALSALADTTLVLGAVAHSGVFKPLATTNLETQFLRPGTGPAIECRTFVVRAGKAMVFTRAEMRAADSAKMVATATATFHSP